MFVAIAYGKLDAGKSFPNGLFTVHEHFSFNVPNLSFFLMFMFFVEDATVPGAMVAGSGTSEPAIKDPDPLF